ncbi:Hypothetical protein A7982_06508 [Minicystis rosea]|nr:Hypothetical protein A7982_06508 [Minicystis rosea]
MGTKKIEAPKAKKPKEKQPKEKKPKDKAPPGLAPSEREALLALDASFEDAIDQAVAVLVQEARALESAAGKVEKQLLKKSRLDPKTLAALGPRRKLLDRAEAAWTHHRVAALTKDLKSARGEAEALKADLIHALRHFLEEDEAVQAQVDAIIPGTGLVDLVDDLKKLAVLADAHASAITKADLPKNASKRARDFAEQLSAAVADRAFDAEGAAAMTLRNRAYWWLREAMDAVRSAGRYVFRDEIKILAAFRASRTRTRARASAKASAAPDAPIPVDAPGEGP